MQPPRIVVVPAEHQPDTRSAEATDLPVVYLSSNHAGREALVQAHHALQQHFAPVVSTASSTPSTTGADEGLVGGSESIRDLREFLHCLTSTDTAVLITGESGTGKELIADLIQKNSRRAGKPFVCVNCAAIPDNLVESELFGYERGAFTGAQSSRIGKLEAADGGTVFLDEIGDMSLYAQAKILRVLENRELQRLGSTRTVKLNVRVIAATHHDLDADVAGGRFRSDLYFRLNIARVHVPALRERKADIPLLLEHFLHSLNSQFGRRVEGFTADAMATLLRHEWPGNVRELRNVLEAVFVNLPARHIAIIDLSERVRKRFPASSATPPNERDHAGQH